MKIMYKITLYLYTSGLCFMNFTNDYQGVYMMNKKKQKSMDGLYVLVNKQKYYVAFSSRYYKEAKIDKIAKVSGIFQFVQVISHQKIIFDKIGKFADK